MNHTKPPKNGEAFLGLIEAGGVTYWEIFFWATKKDGVRKACYVDRGLFDMPKIKGWLPLPHIEEI